MSQYPQPNTVYINQPAPSNGLGLAGFIVSLVSLVVCVGLFSPIGLIMSFVAMFRRPRGFAIAGVVLGLVGSVWVFILVAVIGLGAVATAFGVAEAKEHAEIAKAYAIGDQIVADIERFENDTGLLPPMLDMVDLSVAETDPWGNRYRYTLALDDETQLPVYTLSSDGPDGLEGTFDDLIIYPVGERAYEHGSWSEFDWEHGEIEENAEAYESFGDDGP